MTMDHVYMRDRFGEPGIESFPDVLNIYDLGTHSKYSIPVSSHDTFERYVALNDIKGRIKISQIYSDNFPSLAKATHQVGATMRDHSQGTP